MSYPPDPFQGIPENPDFQPFGAPGRVVERRERREIAGRVFEIVWEKETELTPDGKYHTRSIIHYPTADCGCQPESLDDLHPCFHQECQRVVCSSSNHCLSCQRCGLTFCSNHIQTAPLGDTQSTINCQTCARLMNEPEWLQMIRNVWNFLTGGA